MLRNLLGHNTEPTNDTCPIACPTGQACGNPATVTMRLKVNNHTTNSRVCQPCAHQLTDTLRTSMGLH